MTLSYHPTRMLAVAVALSIGVTAIIVGPADAAASPPSVVTGPASALSVNAVTLSGNVNPNAQLSTWYFDYGTTTNYGLTTAHSNAGSGDQVEAVAVHIDGLTPGTKYHYRLVAESSGGTTIGSDMSFSTPAFAPSIEKAASTDIQDTRAVITTELNPNGLSTTWYVRYWSSSGPTLTTPTSAAGTSTDTVDLSASLSKLTAHTTYDFEVVATNAVGTRHSAEEVFATTGAALITSESISALSTTSVTLNGSVVPDGHATHWRFQYGTTPSYGSDTSSGDAGSSMTSVSVNRHVSGLLPNTTYHFRLIASSADGSAIGPDSTFTTPGPKLVATPGIVNFGRSITLSGTVPEDVANESVSIYAQSGASPSFVEVATVLTGVGGTWGYVLAPRIGTTYKVIWKGEVSQNVTVKVSPSVFFRVRSHDRIVAYASGTNSYAGHLVRLQRFEGGAWRTIAARRLNRDAATTFQPNLPFGISRLRLYLTAYQAGVGYVAGYSAVHRIRRAKS